MRSYTLLKSFDGVHYYENSTSASVIHERGTKVATEAWRFLIQIKPLISVLLFHPEAHDGVRPPPLDISGDWGPWRECQERRCVRELGIRYASAPLQPEELRSTTLTSTWVIVSPLPVTGAHRSLNAEHVDPCSPPNRWGPRIKAWPVRSDPERPHSVRVNRRWHDPRYMRACEHGAFRWVPPKWRLKHSSTFT